MGKNYDQIGSVLPFTPIGDRKVMLTTIEGELMLDLKPMPIPLKYQKLDLVKAKKVISSTSSDSNGKFKFTDKISNGNYEIRVNSKKYSAAYSIEVGSSKIQNLRIFASKLLRVE